jgi:uncharacterized protein (TIGR04562 family)
MNKHMRQQELYHEVFGSILDRTEMTPYLLGNCDNYQSALNQATLMMVNRGFDATGNNLCPGEKERALVYVRQAKKYFSGWLFPFVIKQMSLLELHESPQNELYKSSITIIENLKQVLADENLSSLIEEDPRHLFLLASSIKYPNLFYGYREEPVMPASSWQRMGCSILKMCHLVKSIEEDSQDVNDYARLGIFLESREKSLSDLFSFDWDNPGLVPVDEPPRRAFIKLSTFFHKMSESMYFDAAKNCHIFNSGDGVRVDIIDIKARLKSPESMFTKLGKNVEGEAYDIRDILAITFLLKEREDSLTLFHALQKRGVILQENTVSQSITQTLFDSPDDMTEAVNRLMVNIARSEGLNKLPTDDEVAENSRHFFDALSVNTRENIHSSDGHRKFQCKINFSVPIHRESSTHRILVPGTSSYAKRQKMRISTQQHSLPVEIRISDFKSWVKSEQRGSAHHDAYKLRQFIFLMNRLFRPVFYFPMEFLDQLIKDQEKIFP